MKITFCTLAAILWLVGPGRAGTITGTVRAQGKEGVGAAGAAGKYESKKFKFAPRVDYSALRDFVVYVEDPPAEAASPADAQIVVQKDAVFRPHVLPIQVGTTVSWPNQDDIFHNAFSMSEPKPFDLDLYKDGTKQITFDKPGRVDVFCSIHSGMHCIILILETPYFCTTDEQGRYTIPALPAGTYHLRAWHERLPAQTQTITVPDEGEVKVDFTLGITGLPEY